MQSGTINVLHAHAAGLDVHKMQITATVRMARPGTDAACATEVFCALPSGLDELTAWLTEHHVTAAVMEATGVYWEVVFDALEEAGIEAILVHAQHVKQLKGRKTGIAGSMGLARICQFGLCTPSFVPPAEFRGLRKVSRQRRQVVRERSRTRARIHQTIDSAGIRVGGVLSDLFGSNGLRILDGLVEGRDRDTILASLTNHVAKHLGALHDALGAKLTPHTGFILKNLVGTFISAGETIKSYDTCIEEQLAACASQIDLSTTIPGIDRVSAQAIVIEPGPDIAVFPSSRHCTAWAGLCPGNNESAGKRRSGRARKGNSALRALLVECAWRRPHQGLPVPGLPQGADRAPRLQEGHRRHRPQNAAHHLHHARHRRGLPGSQDRPRGPHGQTQRPTLDRHAQETRHRSDHLGRCRLTILPRRRR